MSEQFTDKQLKLIHNMKTAFSGLHSARVNLDDIEVLRQEIDDEDYHKMLDNLKQYQIERAKRYILKLDRWFSPAVELITESRKKEEDKRNLRIKKEGK